MVVSILNRGKLVKIANKELGDVENCELVEVGSHAGTKWSTIIDVNLIRFFKLCRFSLKHRPKIAVGNGFMHGLIGKLFNFPVLAFSDDIERKIPYFLMTRLSNELYYVTGSNQTEEFSKVKIFNTLKEWAYLSPTYFKPRNEVLTTYGVEEKSYIFVREVITGTLNYNSQTSDIVATISSEFPKDIQVLLSLEDKSKINSYPDNWILLQEPIEDIHSLMYYSRIIISSGDSMAREGAMLGVPSIYCGVREMKANKVMIDKGRLFHKKAEDLPPFIEEIVNGNQFENQVEFREELKKDWIDATDFIIDRINTIKK